MMSVRKALVTFGLFGKSLLFFLMLLLLGIDSAFSLAEAVNAVLIDRYKQLPIAKISIRSSSALLP